MEGVGKMCVFNGKLAMSETVRDTANKIIKWHTPCEMR